MNGDPGDDPVRAGTTSAGPAAVPLPQARPTGDDVPVSGAGEAPARPGRPPTRAQPAVPSWASHRAAPLQEWFPDSLVGQVWAELKALDFINRGTVFASALFLCFVPFMIVIRSYGGRSEATTLVARFGLDRAAADAVSHVFTSPSATSGAISGFSLLFILLGAVSVARAIQQLYEHAFHLDTRGARDTHRQLAWLLLVVAVGALSGWAGPLLRGAAGPVLLAVVGMAWFTGFWWLSMWLLLGGRMGWSQLFPSALATAVLWLGTTIALRVTMSSTISSDYAKYGAVGVIFAVMSVLITVGVVIVLGACAGRVWQDRRGARKAAGAGVR